MLQEGDCVMRNVFQNIDLTKGLDKAKEHYYHVSLDTDYKWGVGWGSDDYEAMKNAKNFENVHNTLIAHADEIGYKFQRPTSSGACPELKSKNITETVDLYIHPMEITGVATKETMQKIISVLKENCSEQIREIRVDREKELYDVSDAMYQRILDKNSSEIFKALKEGSDISISNHEYFNAGMDFAKATRIPRIQNRTEGVLCSSDIDVAYVESLYRVGKNLHLFDNKIYEMIDRVTTIEKEGLDELEEDIER